MEFNDHKQELIQAITNQIKQIDDVCSLLSNKIYLYSQKRLEQLEKQYIKVKEEMGQIKKTKNDNDKIKRELMSTLHTLKDQEMIIEREIREKEKQIATMERDIIFAEEKDKEEQPHLESYLNQRSKSVQSNKNIKYAKDKLKNLEKTYLKQAEEVQYKYRLITLMKQQLKGIRTENKGKNVKQSKLTYDSFHEVGQSENICPNTVIPRNTQQSKIEDSFVSEEIEEHL